MIMKAIKDIVIRAASSGYEAYAISDTARSRIGMSMSISANDLEFVLDLFRSSGIRFTFER